MSLTVSSKRPTRCAARSRCKAMIRAAIASTIQLSGSRARPAPVAVEPPPLTPLKYTEDYSYLRDPGARSGAWWEPLKFVPIDSAGWAYLTGARFSNRLQVEVT
jgi:hypothetical protein